MKTIERQVENERKSTALTVWSGRANGADLLSGEAPNGNSCFYCCCKMNLLVLCCCCCCRCCCCCCCCAEGSTLMANYPTSYTIIASSCQFSGDSTSTDHPKWFKSTRHIFVTPSRAAFACPLGMERCWDKQMIVQKYFDFLKIFFCCLISFQIMFGRTHCIMLGKTLFENSAWKDIFLMFRKTFDST